ncbi:MAG: hypothetical protein ABIH77_06200 [Pseudomonadota bacterium]|nr:hypothetical protein [Gammaproteobacteria bacterium]MBU1558685.1 hypothetical protein [Gammaproteobacteria bacterium]MBU1629398.1 hypothetical protein [Gammaproteobacteria bacterium]MBU1926196.1 hypothetical protein [Gammaproteobacteria bacterium]MBU2545554.1 hypothetical protein [Gammaproteobacteria bacterium]
MLSEAVESVIRNVMQVFLPKSKLGHRMLAIDCQIVFVVNTASLVLIGFMFAFGLRLMLPIALLVAAAQFVGFEACYLLVNANRHRSSLKDKINSEIADGIDKATYFILDSCRPCTYPKILKSGLKAVMEVPVLEGKGLKKNIERKSNPVKVAYTVGYALVAPIACLTKCPATFFRKTGQNLKERYQSVLARARYTPVR